MLPKQSAAKKSRTSDLLNLKIGDGPQRLQARTASRNALRRQRAEAARGKMWVARNYMQNHVLEVFYYNYFIVVHGEILPCPISSHPFRVDGRVEALFASLRDLHSLATEIYIRPPSAPALTERIKAVILNIRGWTVDLYREVGAVETHFCIGGIIAIIDTYASNLIFAVFHLLMPGAAQSVNVDKWHRACGIQPGIICTRAAV
jgi:hypothetical protein